MVIFLCETKGNVADKRWTATAESPQFSAPSNQEPVVVPQQACQKSCPRTAQGDLSLHHNWNTNSWNLSLMITEMSTTLSRPRSARKFFLLPLFLSPRLTGEVAGPLAPCIGLSRIELFVSPDRRSSSRMRASYWASSRFRRLSFSSSSSFFRSFRCSRRRKETVVASTSSPRQDEYRTSSCQIPVARRKSRFPSAYSAGNGSGHCVAAKMSFWSIPTKMLGSQARM